MAAPYTIQVGEIRNCAIDFSDVLDTDESFTGTVTITGTAAVTLDNKAISDSTLTINGREVDSGKAITYRVEGVSAAADIPIKVTCSTDASPAQTIIETVELTVEA